MVRLAAFSCTLLLVLSLMNARARADAYTGTWNITPGSSAGQVHLEMRYKHVDRTGSDEWEQSHDVPVPHVTNNSFTISNDAGQFRAQGTFITPTQGGGIWTFIPNPSFAHELQRRGIGAPSEKQQFELAIDNFTLSSLDTLLASGFARPSVDDLVRMGEHGVDSQYIAQLRGADFSSKTVDSLIRLRDHGVTPQYIQDLQKLGYRPSTDELVRLVDHGVTVSFIERMRKSGYTHLSADDLIRLRDHGF